MVVIGAVLKKFWVDSYCFGHVADFYYDKFWSVSFNDAMLSSIFRVIDDVYSAVDREVGGIVDGCFCRNVSGWSNSINHVGCCSYSISHVYCCW